MKYKGRKKLLTLVITLIVLILGHTINVFALSSAEILQKQKEHEQNQKAITDAENQKKEIKSQMTDIQKQVDDLDNKISDYERDIYDLNSQIEEVSKNISFVEVELQKTQKELDDKEELLEKRLVASYKAGETSYLDVLLNSDSLTSFLSSYYLVEQISENDSKLINAVKETKQEIENSKKQLEANKASLESMKQTQVNKKAELDATKQEKQTAITQLSDEDKAVQAKIDEMRKSFISDVSHELKTPIALIQGYSEGLLENVNTDEESRKFYAEVILDEATKMDKMVRQLIELTKLEYENREFNNRNFNIVELEKEICRSSKVMIEEKGANVEFETADVINVYADDFYIEQVVTNYITNAIKHVKEVDGEKYIKITNEVNIEKNNVRIKVFNTGEQISEEHMARIWNRFYKIDESRNRSNGGTGIGLAFVKAIMTNYGKDYGLINKENGVEFYFDLELKIK